MSSPLVDLGPADADITDPDAYVAGVPYATFQRLRDTDPVSWWPEPRISDARLNGRIERLRSNFISGIKRLPIAATRA